MERATLREVESEIPFGGGTRRCLGASFAEFEMRTVIRAVLGASVLMATSPDAEPVARQGITLVPGRGAWVPRADRLVAISGSAAPRSRAARAA